MTPLIRGLHHLAFVLTRLLHLAGVLLFMPALMLLVTVDVVMRYFFNTSIEGGTEIGQLLLLVVFFASMPYCTLRYGHVYMELFYKPMKGPARRVADVLAACAGLSFAVALTWASADRLIDMYKFGEGAQQVSLPFWPFAAVLFVSGALVCVVFLVQLLMPLFGMPLDREEYELG